MQWVRDHCLRGEAGRLDRRAAPPRAGDLTMASAIDGAMRAQALVCEAMKGAFGREA